MLNIDTDGLAHTSLLRGFKLRDEVAKLGYTPLSRWQVFVKRRQGAGFPGQLLSYIPDIVIIILAWVGVFIACAGTVMLLYTAGEYIINALDPTHPIRGLGVLFLGVVLFLIAGFALMNKTQWRRVYFHRELVKKDFYVFTVSDDIVIVIKIPLSVKSMSGLLRESMPDASQFIEYAEEDPFFGIERDGKRVYLKHWMCE